MQSAPFGIGISITAIASVVILFKHEPIEPKESLPLIPPRNFEMDPYDSERAEQALEADAV